MTSTVYNLLPSLGGMGSVGGTPLVGLPGEKLSRPSSSTPHATDYFPEIPKVPPTALCRLPAATNQETLDPEYPWNQAIQEQSLVQMRRTTCRPLPPESSPFQNGRAKIPPHHIPIVLYGLSEGSDRLPIKQP
jgi:hypothetical protein